MNLSITSKTPLIQFVTVVRILKLCVSLFLTAQSIPMNFIQDNDKNVIQGIIQGALELGDSHIFEVLLH